MIGSIIDMIIIVYVPSLFELLIMMKYIIGWMDKLGLMQHIAQS